MSGKPALIRQRDVTRIVKGFADAGQAVEMIVEDGRPVFRTVDKSRATTPPVRETDAEAAFRQEWGARHAG